MRISNINNFIDRSIKVHGLKYNYSKSNYVDYRTPLLIICPIHGEFYQSPNKHISKQRGCPMCGNIKKSTSKTKTTKQFIEESIKVHGLKYNYSKTEYTHSQKILTIICPIHGKFQQIANDHLRGHGCPICNQSKLEKMVEDKLDELNVEYIKQYKINNSRQRFDFYLPKHNIAIECQGKQHFEPIEHFGGEKEFEKILDRDKKKYTFCEKNNIKLYYILDKNINLNNYIKNNIYNINNILDINILDNIL